MHNYTCVYVYMYMYAFICCCIHILDIFLRLFLRISRERSRDAFGVRTRNLFKIFLRNPPIHSNNKTRREITVPYPVSAATKDEVPHI